MDASAGALRARARPQPGGPCRCVEHPRPLTRTEEERAGDAGRSLVQGAAPTPPRAEKLTASPPRAHPSHHDRKGPEVMPGQDAGSPAASPAPRNPARPLGAGLKSGLNTHPVLRLFSWEKPETSSFSDGRKHSCVWTQVRKLPCFRKTTDFLPGGKKKAFKLKLHKMRFM